MDGRFYYFHCLLVARLPSLVDPDLLAQLIHLLWPTVDHRWVWGLDSSGMFKPPSTRLSQVPSLPTNLYSMGKSLTYHSLKPTGIMWLLWQLTDTIVLYDEKLE